MQRVPLLSIVRSSIPKFVGAVVLSGVLAIGATACGGGGEAASGGRVDSGAAQVSVARDTAVLSAAATKTAGFTTAAVQTVPWRESWTLPGKLVLDPTATSSLGSIVEGRVTRVFVQPGDRVRRGQVLVTIHSHELTDAFNMLAQARAARAEAENTFTLASSAAARAQRLYDARAGSLAELERARASSTAASEGKNRAAAEFHRANELVLHLRPPGAVARGADPEDVLVRSPLDGVVVTRDAEPGMVVLPGSELVTVSRTTALLLEVQVPETAVGAVAIGTAVQFTVPAYPDRRFSARVSRLSPALDTVARTAAMYATLDNRGNMFRAAMTANTEIVGAIRDTVVAVPLGAVQDFEGDTVVVTAVKRGDGLVLEAVRVRVGRRAAGLAEIRSGVGVGVSVVSGGAAIARAEVLRQRDAGGDEPTDKE
jgi:membrane fusion protein, heavy metal efflux system